MSTSLCRWCWILVGVVVASCAADARGRRAVAAPAPGEDTSLADRIIRTWDDLLDTSHAVYLARWSTRTGVDGGDEHCATPIRVVEGRGGDLPALVCAPASELAGQLRRSMTTPRQSGLVWVSTGLGDDGEERLVAVVDDLCASEPCAEPPRDELVAGARGGPREHLWRDIPAEHRRCGVDAECVALEANCFETAVAASAAPAYRTLLDRVGAPCGSPAAGPCWPNPIVAVCRDGLCATAPAP